ncbi:DUF2892 domain containing protein [Sulfitobacter noctilucicola]|uniref:Inner membrane protein YgaP-like transmembrane domain-containing protein n=1 Tax=Sulfitobacter noctilucicola TaxID=1342301 RepID=A0A7W6Q2P8_9RHOB|nr:DUF2892 domain-containing protein [Sulfitobacter noctilucicola]KIN62689.1 DUF2892 domain containing protein [Sulfitobacter noctilucicola]MBB4172778.1 hypothetical protein [Sulfitobacter noctilucicola]
MTVNLGKLDRLVRAFLGLLLVFLPLLNMPQIWSNAGYVYASMAVGLVLTLTALFQFCPLYRLVGFSTCKL